MPQHTTQLGGVDVPMLEELLPLGDLHDPFLDAAWHAPPSRSQQQGSDGSTPQRGVPAMPGALFSGIPAYAEPGSPAAELLNNSAHGLALGSHAALPAGPPLNPSILPEFGGLVAAAFDAQDAKPGAATFGLPPAIAAAQQQAAARLQAQCAHSAGNSLASNGSAASGAVGGGSALPFPRLVGAVLPRSDDSSAGHAQGMGVVQGQALRGYPCRMFSAGCAPEVVVRRRQGCG